MSHSTNETGHTKNLENFKDLYALCETNTPPYNPTQEKIVLTSLNKLRIKAETAHKQVFDTRATIIPVINARQVLYERMPPLSTRVIQALAAATEDKRIVADARRYTNKIHGKFSRPQTRDDQEGQETREPNSNSQRSYDKLQEHFNSLIALLENVPPYTPNEEDLTIDFLKAYMDEIANVEKQMIILNGPYNKALNERDKVFYDTPDSLVPVTKTVKNYLKSLFGIKSHEYREASRIKFKMIKRKK